MANKFPILPVLAGIGAYLYFMRDSSAYQPAPEPGPSPSPGPEPEPAPAPAPPALTVLSVGSSGKKVKEWQRLLCAWSMQDLASTYGLTTFDDGIFGPATESATKVFQAEANKNSTDQMPVDGIVGALTQSSMYQYFERGQDPNGLTWSQAKSQPCNQAG